MGNENEGLIVSNDDGVYYIPNDQLAGFKLAAEDAESVRTSVGSDEVSGFAQGKGGFALRGGMDFAFSGPRPMNIGGPQRPGDSIAVEVVANYR